MTKLLAFYRYTTNTLRKLDAHHLVTVGGFIHMDERIGDLPWWWGIDALPHNDIVALHVYSRSDRTLIPAVAAFGRLLARPTIVDEFGMPQGQGDGAFAGGSGYNGIVTGRAQFYADVFRIGHAAHVAGFVFWNMGCQVPRTPTT